MLMVARTDGYAAVFRIMSDVCVRSFEEHLQKLLDDCGIWRPDHDLMNKAESLLNLTDTDDEDESPNELWTAHLKSRSYCELKSEFLLSLSDCDDAAAAVKAKQNMWDQKAEELWAGCDEEAGGGTLEGFYNNYTSHYMLFVRRHAVVLVECFRRCY
jgi:hypothetical protein